MDERAMRVPALAALALFVVAGAAQGMRPIEVAVLAGAVTLAAGGVLAWREPQGWPLVGLLAVAAAGVFVLCHGTPSNVGWFGVCVVAGWAAFELPLGRAVAASAVLVAGLAAQWVAVPGEPGWAAWIAGTVFTTVACVVARRQCELVTQLREAQAALTDRARAEERSRIAGEVHDVIGHALTVSLLHVSSARLALEDDPGLARAGLVEAERLVQESLHEVRAAVGLVRQGAGSTAPLPSGAQVEDLVASYRKAGRPVELAVRGDVSALGATRGLALFRIVQESLTNAARHGDASRVRVEIDVDERAVTLRVHNGGASRAVAPEGTGVVGMRERAESLGGSLRAGPVPGGWTVEARLPA